MLVTSRPHPELPIDVLDGHQLMSTSTRVDLKPFKGAERLWRVRPEGGRWLRGGFPLRLSLIERSPQLRDTGTWSEIQAARKGQ